MILLMLEAAAFSTGIYYLCQWRAGVRRRNKQSWDAIVSRLRPDVSAHDWTKSGASSEERWRQAGGAQGLWALFENAGVMLELADFATRNSDNVDRELLASLRSDAMHIRISVLRALAKYAFSQVNDGICVNAYRAAEMYKGMAARTTELLQSNVSSMAPGFAGAI